MFTTNEAAMRMAADLEAAGVEVAAIVDSRSDADDAWAGARPVLAGAVIVDAHGGKRLHQRHRRSGSAHESASRWMRSPCPAA